MIALIEWIKHELPNDGEWWGTAHLVYIDCAEKMKRAGMSEESIKEVLSDLYRVTASEFGA